VHINLAYGKAGLDLDLPDQLNVKVVAPIFVPGLVDAQAALAAALAAPIGTPPLREQLRAGMRVGVIFSDITRATPHEVILPEVLSQLAAAGVAREDITLFEALMIRFTTTVLYRTMLLTFRRKRA
jgi:nickel-dependent lactate racemase